MGMGLGLTGLIAALIATPAACSAWAPSWRRFADSRPSRGRRSGRVPDLPGRGRVAVYAIGAAEAMLLEACGPAWRARYPQLLSMGPLLEEARRRCKVRD
jgi:hypothetical protein